MNTKFLYLGVGLGIGAMLATIAEPALESLPRSDDAAFVAVPSFTSPELATVRGPEQNTRPTLAQIVTLPSYVQQRASVYNLATGADESVLLDLLRQAQDNVSPRDADWILPILYGRYAEIDGNAAFAHVRGRSFTMGADQRALASLFLAWIRINEEAALEKLAGLSLQEKMQIGMLIMQRDSQLSDSRRLALGDRLGLGRYMEQFNVANQLRLTDDPEAQLDELLASSDYRARQYSLMAFMVQWSRRDPAAAIAATDRVSGLNVRRQLRQQVLQQWAQADAPAALEWALAQPVSAQKSQYAMMALQSIATQDPRGAMDLVDRLEPRERDAAMGRVLGMWGMIEPRAAAQWLDNVDDPAIRNQAVSQIAQGYAQQYPSEAVQWVNTLPLAERSRAAQGLFNPLVEVDPNSAVDVLDLIEDPQQRANAAHSLAMNWARHEPVAAVEWIADNIEPERRPEILSSAVQQWAQYDTEAAARYADALESTAEREMAVVALLPYLQSDPSRAEAYYESLTRAESRKRAAQVLFRYWRHSDAARAEEYRVVAGIEEGAEDSARMGVFGTAPGVRLQRNSTVTLSR